jgi:predicted nucleic acid-binding protein
MIAAIAVSQALPIYTFNPKDFAATGAELVELGEAAEHPTP